MYDKSHNVRRTMKRNAMTRQRSDEWNTSRGDHDIALSSAERNAVNRGRNRCTVIGMRIVRRTGSVIEDPEIIRFVEATESVLPGEVMEVKVEEHEAWNAFNKTQEGGSASLTSGRVHFSHDDKNRDEAIGAVIT